jgi:hypothetical protein
VNQINGTLTAADQFNFSFLKGQVLHLKKSCKATIEDVEDADSPQNVSVQNHAASPDPPAATETMTSNMEQRKKVSVLMASPTLLTTCTSQKPGRVKHSNPIYLFYELVPRMLAAGSLQDSIYTFKELLCNVRS